MFKIIENYKQLFTLCIKNQLWENWPTYPEEKPEIWPILADFKQLQTYVEDWVIDPSEVQEILDNADNITEEAKKWITYLRVMMFKNWFSVNDEKSYDSYKSLIENDKVKLPSWSDIENELEANTMLKRFKFNFNWFEIKEGKIELRFDWLGYKDTLNMSFGADWKIKSEDSEWSHELNEEEKFENKAGVNKNLFKKSIEELTAIVDWNNQQPEKPTEPVKPVETKEQLKQKSDREAINFNKAEFTQDWMALIQEKLGMNLSNTELWIMGPKTLAEIQKLSPDGKVWLWVLKQLKLVDADNKAINGLTKDMFKPWKLEKWNSSKIIFEETSIIEGTMSWIEATYEQVTAWLDEAFTWNEDLKSFIWANWETIVIEYNKDDQVLSIDTAFFDWVSDYPLEINKDKITNKIAAVDYLKWRVEAMKAEYDSKALEAAVWKEDLPNASYEQEEAVIVREAGLDIDDLWWDTIIKNVPEGKKQDLVKFYKHSGLSLIDFKSLFSEWHSYNDLKDKNTFTWKRVEWKDEISFKDLNTENEFIVTGNEDLNSFNIDWWYMDIWGIDITNVPDPKELAKLVSWYNSSMKSTIDLSGGTIDYKDIKNDLFEL